MEHIVVFDGPTLSELETFINEAAEFLTQANTFVAKQSATAPHKPESDTADTKNIFHGATNGQTLTEIEVVSGPKPLASSVALRPQHSQPAAGSADPTAHAPVRAVSAQNNVSFDQSSDHDDIVRRSGSLLDGLVCAAGDSQANPVVNGRLSGDNKNLPYEFIIPVVAKSNVVSARRFV